MRCRSFRGLGRASSWARAALTLALLALAGIPPLAGFADRVFLLSAAIDGGMGWLAIIAAANITERRSSAVLCRSGPTCQIALRNQHAQLRPVPAARRPTD